MPPMLEKLNIISQKLSGREKESREKNEAADKVAGCVRDLWGEVKRRVRRLKQPAEVLTFYQLPLSSETPRLYTLDELIVMGQRLVVDDTRAVTAGYPAMVNPSAADLNALVQSAQTEKEGVAIADREYDQAYEALAALLVQTDEMIGEVMAPLRYALRRWGTLPVSLVLYALMARNSPPCKASCRMSQCQNHRFCTIDDNDPCILKSNFRDMAHT